MTNNKKENQYITKGNMFVLKTPRIIDEFKILAIGVDKYGNQLIRATKGLKQKTFQKSYSYELFFDYFLNEKDFKNFTNHKNGMSMLKDLKRTFA